MKNLARVFFALWYLAGCLAHVYLGLMRGETYRPFGESALLPVHRRLWKDVVMPHITVFTLLLASFELTTGLLILARGRAVKVGLGASIAFNLYLVEQGLGSSQRTMASDFLANRLINLVFAAAQVPLFWVRYEEPFWKSVIGRRGL